MYPPELGRIEEAAGPESLGRYDVTRSAPVTTRAAESVQTSRILLQVASEAASRKIRGKRKNKTPARAAGVVWSVRAGLYLLVSALGASLWSFFSFLAFFDLAFFSAFASFLVLASCDAVSWANTPADKLRVRAAANNSVRSFFIVLNAPYGFVFLAFRTHCCLRCTADECPGSGNCRPA